MIFATVGTQLPFDRLIGHLDQWAERHPDVEIVAQIGPSRSGFSHLKSIHRFLAPPEHEALLKRADIVVSHAGMGTILTCMQCSKPLIVMPRRLDLGEHRNDHQMDTVRRLRFRNSIAVVQDYAGLEQALDAPPKPSWNSISPFAESQLLVCLRDFLSSA